MRTLIMATGIWLAACGASVCLAQDQANAACAACHPQAQHIQNTAHGSVGCAACHPGHEKAPHPAGTAKPRCADCHSLIESERARGVHGQIAECSTCHGDAHQVTPPGSVAFRKRVPDTCGMCHQEVAGQYKASVHGRALGNGVKQAPLCTDCHGEHSIEKHTTETSPVHVRHIRETCARCHGDIRLTSRFGLPPDRVASFDATFHGLAARAGSETVANCASCHGVHNILPSSDPQSTIHAKNLAATCGHCHPGAGQRFSLGPVHVVPGRAEPRAASVVREVYLVLIPFTIGLMVLHNLGDWIRKVAARRHGVLAARCEYPGEFRMFGPERLQHALLVISFVTLVWTGFALKYPDQFWARPLVAWESSWSLRGIVHRVAAGVFLGTAALHLFSLIFSARLRQHWASLRPNYLDLRTAAAVFAYNLGLRRERPLLPPHSYVEKAEYWSVAWGAVVMSVSGVILWANSFFLAHLPKAVMDVATAVHFYEAVLAALAIVVWHFYFVIFDPDVYPMDTAWLDGFSARKRAEGNPVPENGPQPSGRSQAWR